MVKRIGVVRAVVILAAVLAGAVLGSTPAMAAELDDYLWTKRPLLVFAPSDDDPRLAETRKRIEATRCDFVDRDMVLGVVVTEGASTLDGQSIDAEESAQLTKKYGVGADAFTVLLIGKDGGEKRRVNGVPDLQSIYDLIDGMPMRSGDRGQC
jgi:hypothetical protein